MPKKINFGSKPKSLPDQSATVENWVSTRSLSSEDNTPVEEEKVKMKRLTLDIPEPLHRAIKMQAVEQGVAMADLLRDLLAEHFGTHKGN